MKPISKPFTPFLTGRPLVIMLTVCCTMTSLLFGYDQGVMGGLVSGNQFLKVFPSLGKNNTLLGTTVAIYEVGAFLSSLLFSHPSFSTRLGRRRSIMLGSTIAFVGAALQAGSVDLTMLIVTRIVTGCGIGILTSITPSYHSECVPPKYRGTIVSSQLTGAAIGLSLSFWTDYGCAHYDSEFQWRFPVAFQCVFPILIVSFLFWLPESPRWLMEQDREEEAKESLFILSDASASGNRRELNTKEQESMDEVEKVLSEIKEAIDLERKAGGLSYWDCFKDNDQCYRYRTILCITCLAFQQLTGINLATYYQTILFERSLGLSHHDSLLLTGGNGLNSLFWVAFSTAFLIDRVGRVRLMYLSAACQAATMAILAGVTRPGSSKGEATAGAVMLYVYFAVFSAGWLNSSWLYPAEIAPLSIRARATALASASNWIWNFVVVEVTPDGVSNLGNRYYIVWAVINAAMVPILYFFFPETSHLSLEQIDALFASGKVWVRRSPRAAVDLDDFLEKRDNNSSEHEIDGDEVEKQRKKGEIELEDYGERKPSADQTDGSRKIDSV